MKAAFQAMLGMATLLAFAIIGQGNQANAQQRTVEPNRGIVNSTVVSDAGGQVDISIYGARLAQVQETRIVHLPAGRTPVQLYSIATQYRQDSLRVLGAKGAGTFTYRTATYQPADLTSENILAKSVGNNVEVVRYGTDSQQTIAGKLLSVSGGQLVISTSNGETHLVSSREVRLSNPPKGLSNTSSLVVEADVSAAGTYELTFMYETTGLSWAAKHTVVYDDVESKLESWQTAVSVVNNSGVTYRDATLRLLSGAAAGNEEAPGRMYSSSLRTMADRAPGGVSFEEASVEDVGDQKTYTVPGTVTLNQGQVRQIVLLDAHDVPVTREYFVPAHGYGDAQSNVSIRLTVENCLKHNLGKPLPAGPVKVYQYNSAGIQQQTGSARIGDKAQDEVFDMVIGTASDIKYTRALVEQKDIATAGSPAQAKAAASRVQGVNGNVVVHEPTYADQTWEVKIFNYKRDRDVTVKVEVSLPADQTDLGSLTRKSATEAYGNVTAPKSGNQSLKYTFRVRTN